MCDDDNDVLLSCSCSSLKGIKTNMCVCVCMFCLPFLFNFEKKIFVKRKTMASFFADRKGNSRVGLKGIDQILKENEHYCSASKAIPFEELKEGDIILLRGRKLNSRAIAFWSKGASHVGQLVKLDGELWFVEAVSWRDEKKNVIPFAGEGKKGCLLKSGVVAAALPQLLKSYIKSGVYRPIPALTERELQIMRDEFKALHGKEYEHNVRRLLNSIPALPAALPTSRFYCSQLTAHFFRKIGRLRKDFSKRRFANGDYLPSHIVKAVDTRYLGCLRGTDPLPKPVR